MGRLNTIYVLLFGGLLVRLLTLVGVLYLGPYNALSSSDSLGFYEDALYVAQSGDYYSFEIGWKPYVNAIGFLMYQFGESISMMFLLSAAAWLCSAILIDRSLAALKADHRSRVIVAAIMAFFPSILFTTSIPMREAYQLLAISIIAFAVIKLFIERNMIYLFHMIFGSILASILHLSLFASTSVFIALLFLGLNFARGKLSITQLIASVSILLLITGFVISFVQSGYQGDTDSIFATVEAYRDGGATLDARAQYSNQDEVGVAGTGGIIELAIGFVQYMVEPFPWRISALGDIIVLLENIFRLVLIVFAVRHLKNASHQKFALSLTLLMMFFAVEFVWSAGTINWGTAARHHVPSFPLLLIACFAFSRQHQYTQRSLNMRFQRI